MIFMVIDMSLIFAIAMFLEIFFQKFWIRRMHRLNIEQVTKMYGPAWHDKAKMGTPSMGGGTASRCSWCTGSGRTPVGGRCRSAPSGAGSGS